MGWQPARLAKLRHFNQEPMTGNSTPNDSTNFSLHNNINSDKRKRLIFLTVIGTRAYSLLSNLIVPAKLSTKLYAELMKGTKDHMKPTPLVT